MFRFCANRISRCWRQKNNDILENIIAGVETKHAKSRRVAVLAGHDNSAAASVAHRRGGVGLAQRTIDRALFVGL